MNLIKKFGLFLREDFRLSAKALKNTRALTAAGMLLALEVVLASFASIQILPQLYISFSFIALGVTGYMFGPVVAMLSGGIGDILGYLMNPQPPFRVEYTLLAMASGLIYGLCLYRMKRKQLLFMVPIGKALVNLMINGLLNSLLLSYLYGLNLPATMTLHLVKNVIALPLEAALLILVLLFLEANREKFSGR